MKEEGGRRKAQSEPHPSSFILHPLVESGTFRFRDPLNKERRFLHLRLEDVPIRGSLAQFRFPTRQRKRNRRQIRLGRPFAGSGQSPPNAALRGMT